MRTVGLLASLGLAAGAGGQVIITPGIGVRLDLTWEEDPAHLHNDNGVLEPGEHALMLMSLTIIGQFTPASFAPPIGTYHSGTIRGLAGAYLDIRSASADPTGLYNGGITVPASSSVGPNAGSTGTSGYGVRGGWRIGGNVANGQPVNNGFASIGPGQSTGPGSENTTNPITNLYRLGWQPNTYAPRTAAFSVRPAAAAGGGLVVELILDLDGGTTTGNVYVSMDQVVFGSVEIPTVPGPAGFVILGLSGLIAGRRVRAAMGRCMETRV